MLPLWVNTSKSAELWNPRAGPFQPLPKSQAPPSPKKSVMLFGAVFVPILSLAVASASSNIWSALASGASAIFGEWPSTVSSQSASSVSSLS
eukprot:15431893-Alexandrium_andersonii.AAC.1